MHLAEIAKHRQRARAILEENTRGGYTVPCKGLYPFQWNWDSVFVALGWATFDEARAWLEIETLLEGQWQNGMVPHIVFHQHSDTYFPGAKAWGVKQTPPTSSVSQPPILAEGCLLLYQGAKDKKAAKQKLRALYPKICAYHRWWQTERVARGGKIEELPVSLHPWESGMDNSPAWDAVLAHVPEIGETFIRQDTDHVAAEQRPTDDEYRHYLYLVKFFKDSHFAKDRMLQSPYLVYDIGILSLLYRSGQALGKIATLLGLASDADALRLQHLQEKIQLAIAYLWANGIFHSYDINANRLIDVETSAAFLTLYAGLANPQQAASMHTKIEEWLARSNYGLPSVDPGAPYFESQRYWRGPVWLHMNWMIALGLQAYHYHSTAERLRQASVALIQKSGFAEYYDPISGQGCGGLDFSWPAAVALFWLYQ